MSTEKTPALPDDIQPTIEELPGDLAQLAETIEDIAPGYGVPVVLKLAERFRGTYIYFHNLDALKRKARDRKIIERYSNNERPAELAREYKLSERQVWKILGREPDKERQMKLF